MKGSEIIETIKEFFLDILGYFIPGFITLLILTACIKSDFYFESSILENYKDWSGVVLLIITYVVGYIIYSISKVRDVLFSCFGLIKVKKTSDIESEMKSSLQFKLSARAIASIWTKGNSNNDIVSEEVIMNFSMRELRSAVMSYIPEADVKIYTYMFRAELCNYLNSSFFIISILGFISTLVFYIWNIEFLFLVNTKTITLFAVLFLSSIFLHFTRMRFLSIAYKIPFTIFLSKHNKI